VRLTAVALYLLATALTTRAQPPAGVGEARQEYEATMAKARAALEEATGQAAAAYKVKLAGVRDDLAKEGKLDAALAVRSLLKELDEKPAAPVRSKAQLERDQFAAALSKVAWTAPKGWGDGKKSFSFGADGHVAYSPGGKAPKAWAVVAPGVVVAMTPDAAETPVDVLTFDLVKGSARVHYIGRLKNTRWGWESLKVK